MAGMTGQDYAVLIDGDLVAGATLAKRPANPTLADQQARASVPEPPTNLISRLQSSFFSGSQAEPRIKIVFFTSTARDAAPLAAHKNAVKQAFKAAGFSAATLECEDAASVDTAICTRMLKLMYKRPDISAFIVVSHAADLEPALAEAQGEGRRCYLATLGNAVVSHDVRPLLAAGPVALAQSDLVGLPILALPAPPKHIAVQGSDNYSNAGAGAWTSQPSAQQQQQQPLPQHQQPVMPVKPQPSLPGDEERPLQRSTNQADPDGELGGPNRGSSAAAPQQQQQQQQQQPPQQQQQQQQQPAQQPQPQQQQPPSSASSPPAVEDRPPATDLFLPPGVNAHWSDKYRTYYYTVPKADGTKETTWLHPGKREDTLRVALYVLKWKATIPELAREANEQIPQVEAQLNQLLRPSPQPATAPAVTTTVPQQAPYQAPQVQTNYSQPPPQQQQQPQQYPSQQPYPTSAYPATAQQQTQQQQQQFGASMSAPGYPPVHQYPAPPQQQQQQYAPPPQQHQYAPAYGGPQQRDISYAEATSSRDVQEVTGRRRLPPGWRHFVEVATNREFFYDTTVSPPRKATEAPPGY